MRYRRSGLGLICLFVLLAGLYRSHEMQVRKERLGSELECYKSLVIFIETENKLYMMRNDLASALKDSVMGSYLDTLDQAAEYSTSQSCAELFPKKLSGDALESFRDAQSFYFLKHKKSQHPIASASNWRAFIYSFAKF